jgi:molybdopterin-containing oxidoreductase family molybdopterin binding subunit
MSKGRKEVERMAEESFVYTACPGWGDHDYCALKTIVKDGRIVRTEKTVYPDPEAGVGHICQKGLRAKDQPYHPDRLLYPLKRAGARGEGKWERISWDQALDEIAEKLLEIREESGPESLAIWNFVASIPPMLGLGVLLASRFGGLWGSTDPLQSYGLDNGPQYSAFYQYGSQLAYSMCDPRRFFDSELIIVWGANPVENQTRIAKHIVEARSRGAKVIDIGLVFDATAGMADRFFAAKPGSDLYLALAMANHIVENGLYDGGYLLKNTIAAYLVKTDDGKLLRNRGGFCKVYDEDAGAAVSAPPCESPGAGIGVGVPELPAKTAMEGSFEVDGAAVKTVFTLLREHLAQYTIEGAAEITGIPADDIVALTEEYAGAKSAYILGALGIRYQNQGEFYRAINLLGALTGRIAGGPGDGVTGALLPTGYPLALNDSDIARPQGVAKSDMRFVRQKDFFEQVQSGDPYPIRAFIKTSGNPVHNCPNRGRWVEAFDKMDLVVDIDIWMTDTGELADYVLPDCMPFERAEILMMSTYNHLVLQEPAIEPQGEAKDPTFLFSELAKRVGLGEYFDKTADEWLAMRIDTDYPLIANIDPPLTWERLKSEKIVRSAAPLDPPYDPFSMLGFLTESGRMDIYSERLSDLGFGFPAWFAPLESPSLLGDGDKGEYPYQFFTGRQRFFMQSMFTDDPLMIEMSGKEPAARINPLDAAREGIADGDKVEVYNARGHVVCVMRIDEAIPPGTVHVWFGWRRRQFEEGTYAELLVALGDRSTINDLGDRWYDDTLAIQPPEDMVNGSLTGYAGGWDTIWDCSCNLRRVSDRKEAHHG